SDVCSSDLDDPAGEGLAPLVALAPVLGRPVRRAPRAPHVHPHDGVEVLRRHVPDGAVTDDAGVVHEDVEAPPGVDRLGDHPAGTLVVGHVLVVGDGGSAPRLDELDGQVGVPRRPLTVDRRAQVVDDHLGAVLRQLQRVPATDAVARPRDDGDLALEQPHVSPLAPLQDLTYRQILGDGAWAPPAREDGDDRHVRRPGHGGARRPTTRGRSGELGPPGLTQKASTTRRTSSATSASVRSRLIATTRMADSVVSQAPKRARSAPSSPTTRSTGGRMPPAVEAAKVRSRPGRPMFSSGTAPSSASRSSSSTWSRASSVSDTMSRRATAAASSRPPATSSAPRALTASRSTTAACAGSCSRIWVSIASRRAWGSS